jgi:ABC-type sugar transport system ATPase subunit
MTGSAGSVMLRARCLSKSYAAQRVLHDVDLEIRSGEILALIGENGAGKSTLMRILAGATRADSGSIEFAGKTVAIGSVRQAQSLGIAMIFQELNLVPSRTVAQNIYLGREPRLAGTRGRFGAIDHARLATDAARVLQVVGSRVPVNARVEDLTVGQQQLVEIAKALSFDAKVLFMDEPTSALSDEVANNLLRLMASLRAQGMAIVFTTHRLPEAFRVADRFTVMRDGLVAGNAKAGEVDEARIVEWMVGRPMSQHYPKTTVPIGSTPAIDVSGLSGGMVKDVSFSVYPGEILGFAGLVGAGRTEMARLLFGADKPTRGAIVLDGKAIVNRSPGQAISHGIGFVPEDRKRDSLMLPHSVRSNIVIAGLRKLSDLGLVRSRRVDLSALRFAERLGIRLRSLDQPVAGLSGGNQQKSVLSRWLLMSSRVLILDEPTRGIDVGAKATIYELIGELVGKGLAIIFISSELPEVLGLSDRVAVMTEGRIVRILSRAEATPEVVMGLASHADR